MSTAGPAGAYGLLMSENALLIQYYDLNFQNVKKRPKAIAPPDPGMSDMEFSDSDDKAGFNETFNSKEKYDFEQKNEDWIIPSDTDSDCENEEELATKSSVKPPAPKRKCKKKPQNRRKKKTQKSIMGGESKLVESTIKVRGQRKTKNVIENVAELRRIFVNGKRKIYLILSK